MMSEHSVLLDGQPVTELYDEHSIRRYRQFVTSYAKELSDAGHKLQVEVIKANTRQKKKPAQK